MNAQVSVWLISINTLMHFHSFVRRSRIRPLLFYTKSSAIRLMQRFPRCV